ncbi:hypothetical protein CDAR_114361 [Caerostris darwini]|uniref:Uncharacterized protein n=1 Tax=Caerostris darwini TaxID=1538125 RepID=A0AAV4T3J5_9ARAC|nr:hypothetical protein CDAR_114361 [Caerostris darwini]
MVKTKPLHWDKKQKKDENSRALQSMTSAGKREKKKDIECTQRKPKYETWSLFSIFIFLSPTIYSKKNKKRKRLEFQSTAIYEVWWKKKSFFLEDVPLLKSRTGAQFAESPNVSASLIEFSRQWCTVREMGAPEAAAKDYGCVYRKETGFLKEFGSFCPVVFIKSNSTFGFEFMCPGDHALE